MPLALGDVDGQLGLEEQPDLHGLLTARDPEGLPRMGAGIEVLRAVEGPAQPLDAPKTRQGEALDPALGRVERQQIPVAAVGQQVQGAPSS